MILLVESPVCSSEGEVKKQAALELLKQYGRAAVSLERPNLLEESLPLDNLCRGLWQMERALDFSRTHQTQ